jgi:hypothetical protein
LPLVLAREGELAALMRPPPKKPACRWCRTRWRARADARRGRAVHPASWWSRWPRCCVRCASRRTRTDHEAPCVQPERRPAPGRSRRRHPRGIGDVLVGRGGCHDLPPHGRALHAPAGILLPGALATLPAADDGRALPHADAAAARRRLLFEARSAAGRRRAARASCRSTACCAGAARLAGTPSTR